ncbi:class I SAM-dependent methyltransferase [Kineococcus sp. GCM10028916]|uniref:class I SAM-dependent methyltransferase n=1 Tax=Kineococcus sp. GCM10028916 TaxID=3273394 RepID=UPI003634CF32
MRSLGGLVLRGCDAWMRRHPWDHNAHHRWILRRLPGRVDRALDVGCGTGEFARRLAGTARHVDAVDRDARVVATARTLTHGLPVHHRVHYQVADLGDAPLEPGYDVVTALAVLHHVPFEPALRRLRELLAPGGTLVVLGVYREESRSDVALSLLAVPANLVVGWVENLRQRRVAGSAPTAPAVSTLTQVRAAAARQTPGAAIRRHLFWRYSLVFSAPA